MSISIKHTCKKLIIFCTIHGKVLAWKNISSNRVKNDASMLSTIKKMPNNSVSFLSFLNRLVINDSLYWFTKSYSSPKWWSDYKKTMYVCTYREKKNIFEVSFTYHYNHLVGKIISLRWRPLTEIHCRTQCLEFCTTRPRISQDLC
jgi:hypothetical protein